MLWFKDQDSQIELTKDEKGVRWRETGVQPVRESKNRVVLDVVVQRKRYLILRAAGGSGWAGRGLTAYYGVRYYLVVVVNGIKTKQGGVVVRTIETESDVGARWRALLARWRTRIGLKEASS